MDVKTLIVFSRKETACLSVAGMLILVILTGHFTLKWVFGQALFILWQDGVRLNMPGLASVWR